MASARNNPFATERIEEMLPFQPQWNGESWEGILTRFEEAGWRGAIVGPHGSGKTTFLGTLAARLRSRGQRVAPLFVNRQCRHVGTAFFDSLDTETIILFDGAEQLSRPRWWSFLRKAKNAGGLLITAHRPMRLPSLLQLKSTPDILERCIRRLDDRPLRIASPEIPALFRRHSGNIRHALLECYDGAAATLVKDHPT